MFKFSENGLGPERGFGIILAEGLLPMGGSVDLCFCESGSGTSLDVSLVELSDLTGEILFGDRRRVCSEASDCLWERSCE